MKTPTTIGTRWMSSSNASAGSSSRYGSPTRRIRVARGLRGGRCPDPPAPLESTARAGAEAVTNSSARHLRLGAGELLLHHVRGHRVAGGGVGEQVLDRRADQLLELRLGGYLGQRCRTSGQDVAQYRQ